MSTCEETKEMIKVMQAYVDGAKIRNKSSVLDAGVTWNWGYNEYVIVDPYKELKEAAANPMKQIRYKRARNAKWLDDEIEWGFQDPLTTVGPEEYEIRDKPTKYRLLAWFDIYGELRWFKETSVENPCWTRCPSEDKEIEL